MSTSSRPALSIVIPAHNEASRLGGTLTATCVYLDRARVDAELIVVDDGSTDGTGALVDGYCARDARVELVALADNRGKGAAVRAGVLRARGDRVLFMDADLATPLSELSPLERALDGGADVAIGSRAVARSAVDVRQPRARESMGRLFNLLVRALFDLPFHDTQCGFKLFTRVAARSLFADAAVDRYAFDVELLLRARGRFLVEEVPVRWHHVERSKVSPLRDAPKMAVDLLRLWGRERTRARALPAAVGAMPVGR